MRVSSQKPEQSKMDNWTTNNIHIFYANLHQDFTKTSTTHNSVSVSA